MPEFLHAEPKRGALHASRAAPPFAPATTQLLGAIAQDRLVFLFVERRDQHRLSIRFSWFQALPPVLTRQIGRSLPHGPHQHRHRALNPILGFSNDPGRNGFDTPAVAALNGCAKITRRRAEGLRAGHARDRSRQPIHISRSYRSNRNLLLVDRLLQCGRSQRSNRRQVRGDRGNVSHSRSRRRSFRR